MLVYLTSKSAVYWKAGGGGGGGKEQALKCQLLKDITLEMRDSCLQNVKDECKGNNLIP